MLHLIIKRFVKNENYEQEKKKWDDLHRYDMDRISRQPTIEVEKDVLSVQITDEQFEAIRKAVLEKF